MCTYISLVNRSYPDAGVLICSLCQFI